MDNTVTMLLQSSTVNQRLSDVKHILADYDFRLRISHLHSALDMVYDSPEKKTTIRRDGMQMCQHFSWDSLWTSLHISIRRSCAWIHPLRSKLDWRQQFTNYDIRSVSYVVSRAFSFKLHIAMSAYFLFLCFVRYLYACVCLRVAWCLVYMCVVARVYV